MGSCLIPGGTVITILDDWLIRRLIVIMEFRPYYDIGDGDVVRGRETSKGFSTILK
jgi:hypothetical protein